MRSRQSTPKNIDEYIEAQPPEIREILEKIRATIRKAAPGAEEAIKYMMPTFVLNGNLVHFAACRNHIGFYPAPSGIDNFREELAGYKTSKGAIQFPLDRKIPYALIGRIVRFRAAENKMKSLKRKR